MSYKIRPEDVPEEITRKGLTPQFVVDILEAAIEAGLVSPPCKADRDTMGRLIKSPIGTIRLSPGKPVMSSQEHWKGQTE